MAKVDATTAQAISLYARLQGVDTSKIKPEVEVEPEDDFDIEIVDTPKTKSKTQKNKEKVVPTPPRNLNVPELEQFKKLNRSLTISVTQIQHDIKYKEQIWGIPERAITYNLHVLKNMKVCKDTAGLFKEHTEQDIIDAENGMVRYIKVESYENIPYKSREIAYIKVMAKDGGGFSSKILTRNTVMKENNIDSNKVKKQLEKAVARLYIKEENNGDQQ